MDFTKKIYKATFIKRPNRFNAEVLFNDTEIVVHVPNTGRCREILTPGCTVLLREENNPNRKTKFDLIAAYKDNILINIDSQIPNKVVKEALELKVVDKLKNYNKILSEKTFGSSRFDFKLSNDNYETYFLEVKGVTLEENGYCRFPDAPTQRGTKHILELIDVKKHGIGAGILFLIQLNNIKSFSPNDETDPEFSNALRLAQNEGVDILVYSCKVTETSITLDKPVDIIL